MTTPLISQTHSAANKSYFIRTDPEELTVQQLWCAEINGEPYPPSPWYDVSAAGSIPITATDQLRVVDGELLFNNELLAQASDIQQISEWSNYPALAPIEAAGQNVVGLGNVQFSGGAALGVTAGALTFNGMPVQVGPEPTSADWATFPAVQDVSLADNSLLIQNGQTLGAVNQLNLLTLQDHLQLKDGALTNENGVLMWNQNAVQTASPPQPTDWSVFPALSNVDLSGHQIIGASAITIAGSGGATALQVTNGNTEVLALASQSLSTGHIDCGTITSDYVIDGVHQLGNRLVIGDPEDPVFVGGIEAYGSCTLNGGDAHGVTIGSLPDPITNTCAQRIDVLPIGVDILSGTYITANALGAANISAGGAISVAAGSYVTLEHGEGLGANGIFVQNTNHDNTAALKFEYGGTITGATTISAGAVSTNELDVSGAITMSLGNATVSALLDMSGNFDLSMNGVNLLAFDSSNNLQESAIKTYIDAAAGGSGTSLWATYPASQAVDFGSNGITNAGDVFVNDLFLTGQGLPFPSLSSTLEMLAVDGGNDADAIAALQQKTQTMSLANDNTLTVDSELNVAAGAHIVADGTSTLEFKNSDSGNSVRLRYDGGDRVVLDGDVARLTLVAPASVSLNTNNVEVNNQLLADGTRGIYPAKLYDATNSTGADGQYLTATGGDGTLQWTTPAPGTWCPQAQSVLDMYNHAIVNCPEIAGAANDIVISGSPGGPIKMTVGPANVDAQVSTQFNISAVDSELLLNVASRGPGSTSRAVFLNSASNHTCQVGWNPATNQGILLADQNLLVSAGKQLTLQATNSTASIKSMGSASLACYADPTFTQPQTQFSCTNLSYEFGAPGAQQPTLHLVGPSGADSATIAYDDEVKEMSLLAQTVEIAAAAAGGGSSLVVGGDNILLYSRNTATSIRGGFRCEAARYTTISYNPTATDYSVTYNGSSLNCVLPAATPDNVGQEFLLTNVHSTSVSIKPAAGQVIYKAGAAYSSSFPLGTNYTVRAIAIMTGASTFGWALV